MHGQAMHTRVMRRWATEREKRRTALLPCPKAPMATHALESICAKHMVFASTCSLPPQQEQDENRTNAAGGLGKYACGQFPLKSHNNTKQETKMVSAYARKPKNNPLTECVFASHTR